jgi:microcystin-dependent protein
MGVTNGENGENGENGNGEEERELRPARRTANLDLPIPGDAGPADNVTVVGDLADAIDALSRTGFIGWRTGDIKATAVQTAPDGWLMCNGQAISRAVFAALFEAIDVVFGAGNGTTTFNVPDLRNAFPMGAANAAALGLRGGERDHVLSVAELAHHAHAVNDPTHAHALADPGHGHGVGDPSHAHNTGAPATIHFANGAVNVTMTGYGEGWTSGYSGTGIYIGAAGTGMGVYGAYTGIGIFGEGGNAAHNNMPPYVGVNYIIKA